ncbi:MAG: addiction module protein, partial [Thermoanaerobaculia bacterium]
TQKVLALPLPDRIDLAQALWQSIDEAREGDANAEEREAVEQARRRDRELSAGTVEGRSHQQVMKAARQALR